MTELLALRLAHQPDEPPSHFLARLAALNLRPARHFADDMGLHLQRIANGCDESIRRLAALTETDYQLLVQAAIRKIDGRFELRGQHLHPISLRRSRTLVCPQCLLEDIEHSDLAPHLAIRGRLYWLLSSIRTCHVHRAALVDVTRPANPGDTHDWTARVAPTIADLPDLAKQAPGRMASALEIYLIDRIEGRQPTSWLHLFPFFASATVAELFGSVVTFGKSVKVRKLSEDEKYEAGHVGAELAKDGPTALIKVMAKLQSDHRNQRLVGPHSVLGKLYEAAARGFPDRAYDPLRDLVRSFITDTFALGPGDSIFGEPVTHRRFHTLRSATKEYGCGRVRLKKLLMAEGLLGDDHAPNSAIRVPMHHVKRLVDRENEIVTLKGVQPYLSADRDQVDALLRAGLLTRYSAGSQMRQYFLRSELDEFLSRLFQSAVPVTSVPSHCVTLSKASKRSWCSVTEVIRSILDGKLSWVGRRSDRSGLASILVDLENVRQVVRLNLPSDFIKLREAHTLLKIGDKVVIQLVACGAIDAPVERNPVTRKRSRYVKRSEIERFRVEYVGLFELATVRKLNLRSMKRAIEAEGIFPVDFPGVAATFYRKDSIRAIAHSLPTEHIQVDK